MSQYLTGADAFGALQSNNEPTVSNSFTSLNSGAKITVKVLGEADFFQYYGYGMYQPRVNTFAAKNPSKKTAKGYPIENLTPWDKSWKYHADLSKEFNDPHSKEAYKYMPKARGAFGFFDVDSGEQIVVDFTKNQASVILAAITKYETRLGRLAFELEKTGSSTSTVVSLTPVLDFEEDLTDKQRENYAKAPEEFDTKLFDGIVFEADDAEQITHLITAGFDISLIGLERPVAGGTEGNPVDNTQVASVDDLPF